MVPQVRENDRHLHVVHAGNSVEKILATLAPVFVQLVELEETMRVLKTTLFCLH